ncbi:hypothetical protein M8R20_08525 [Pseudomonas sp. R2.Fl]|nr:hypothetical protein [Pseudomonas sp. R2.Fl]
MFLDDEPTTTSRLNRHAGSVWTSALALASCVLMLVMLSGTASAGTTATPTTGFVATASDVAFTQTIGTADQRILLGLLLIALSIMAATSLGFWRRSVKDFLRAGGNRHGA